MEKKKKLRKVVLWVGVIVLVVSLAALVYALLPDQVQLERFFVDPALLQPPGGLP